MLLLCNSSPDSILATPKLPLVKPRKMPEVMSPRLVASKILRKRWGANKLVADFPTHNSNSDDKESQHYYYKVYVSTWNVGGVSPTDDLNLDGLLENTTTPCDIYAIGFQEVVPLRAANILGAEKSRICGKWNSLIRKSLNKMYRSRSRSRSSREEVEYYRCVISKRMVGILISVWVRTDLHQFVRNPSVCCVGCGIMGLRNKGSVSVRFRLHETSFCFVCSHLASGSRVGDEKKRNSNVAHIFSRTTFPKAGLPNLPSNILDHDRVIMAGDLNYRISMPEQKTRVLVNRGEWDMLFENDQLKQEMRDGEAFEGWEEGVINFAPTYKYYVNSDAYYGTDEAEKKRAPAWCDRILWFGEGLKQEMYCSGDDLKLSDHKPVKAVFNIQVKVLQSVKAFTSFNL